VLRPALLDIERERRREVLLVELGRERWRIDGEMSPGDVEEQAEARNVIHHGTPATVVP
jgi:hypothetical protein